MINMATVQKRLHISGLTPAITENDIRARLEKFVNVKTVDGFGKLNALGEQRKFAYATVDATDQHLARCFNNLSGTLWKGAKLRIGEAKPDYKERLKQESEREQIGNPKKRPRLPRGVQGVHAKDMSPVTLANINSRPGWDKTILSHLIRPMKMRPSRPLPPVPSKLPSKIKSKLKSKGQRKALLTTSRPRIQKIDTRLWDPLHITGKMLQSVVVVPSMPAPAPSTEDVTLSPPHSRSSSSSEKTQETMLLTADANIQRDLPTDNNRFNSIVSDVQQENSQHLQLLSRMFGESPDGQSASQGDVGEMNSKDKDTNSDDEENSRELELTDSREDIVMKDPFDRQSSGLDENVQSKPSLASYHPSQMQKPPRQSFRDLFKYQEDTTFSLMAGLDLDLDLDLGLDPAFTLNSTSLQSQPIITPIAQTESIVQPSAFIYHYEGLKLDPNLPLFFPQPDDPRSKDLVSIAKARGWQFHRTDDSEAIQKRWDEIKGGLTHEWKKRSREAVKARKRRFGADAMEEL